MAKSKYAVTINVVLSSAEPIDTKALKAAKKELVKSIPETIVADAGLDEMTVTCGRATVTIE